MSRPHCDELLRRGDVEDALQKLELTLKDRADKDSLGRTKRWSEAEFRAIDTAMKCRDLVYHMPAYQGVSP